MIMMTA